MKKTVFALLLGLLPCAANADMILGLYAGARLWQVDFSGEVGEKNNSIGLEELGYDKESSNVLWLRFEHPLPLIPNIGLMSSSISASASADVSRDFNLAGTEIVVTDRVYSKIDLDHIDYTLYYELLDNWISLDLGLTARQFSGYLEAYSSTQEPVTGELEGVLPLLYGMAQFDLPFSGWSVAAQVNTISYNGDGIADIQAQVGYELDLVAVDIGVNIGYRSMMLKVEDLDELYADAEIAGAFAELKIHF